MSVPENIKALILDMDGVVWRGDAPIGDLAATFQHIRALGLKFVFATNNRRHAYYFTRDPCQVGRKSCRAGCR